MHPIDWRQVRDRTITIFVWTAGVMGITREVSKHTSGWDLVGTLAGCVIVWSITVWLFERMREAR